MAVKLRLMRMGKTKQPTYRVVAADARSPRNGRFIEIVGTYQPRQEPSVVLIDNEKAVAWLNKGAQPTESAAKLLQIAGVWDAYKDANGKVAASKPKVKSKAKTVKEVPAAAPAPSAAVAPAAEAPAVEADVPAPEAEVAADAPAEAAADDDATEA